MYPIPGPNVSILIEPTIAGCVPPILLQRFPTDI